MEIQNIIDLVETRFLPLITNIKSDVRFNRAQLTLILSATHVHLMHEVYLPNQLNVISYTDWTSVQYCPGKLTEDDLVFVHDTLIEIFETHIKDSKMIVSKREQIKAKITQLEKELQECN